MIGAHKLPIIDGEPTPAHGRRVSDQELIEVVRRCIPKLPNGLWPLPEMATDEALDPMIERRLGFCGGSGGPGKPWEHHRSGPQWQIWACWTSPVPGRSTAGARGIVGRRAVRAAVRAAHGIGEPGAQMDLFGTTAP